MSEFKTMVKVLHSAGIEVLLDVVYNHTAEGNQLGPTLSFRGIDNASYYRLSADQPRYYLDFTGTGNTLNLQQPRVLQMLMDSLRYWVLEMHVDGFRFDLASALARELHDVDRLGSFFDTIGQDPVLSQVKLIAEPWDIGSGGYQVGNFPSGWNEWNDKYRDTLRGYWKGDAGLLGDFARRITGSPDLYEASGRKPNASINFITAHDGFTLEDLVSYNDKHNEANGEGNRDGNDDNRSWNCGAEGPSDAAAVLALRRRQKRNLFAALLLSQGAPMLLGGDELSRTQHGNNNAYCQDNEISWLDWSLDERRARVPRIRAPHGAPAPRAPGLQPPPLRAGRHQHARGPEGDHLARPGCARDERPRLAAGLHALPGGVPGGRCDRAARAARRGHPRQQFPAALQCAPRDDRVPPGGNARRQVLAHAARYRARGRCVRVRAAAGRRGLCAAGTLAGGARGERPAGRHCGRMSIASTVRAA